MAKNSIRRETPSVVESRSRNLAMPGHCGRRGFDAQVSRSSWPGLSGPSVPAIVPRRMAATGLAMTARAAGERGMAWRIGIDIGGTFTDVALVEEGTGRIA